MYQIPPVRGKPRRDISPVRGKRRGTRRHNNILAPVILTSSVAFGATSSIKEEEGDRADRHR